MNRADHTELEKGDLPALDDKKPIVNLCRITSSKPQILSKIYKKSTPNANDQKREEVRGLVRRAVENNTLSGDYRISIVEKDLEHAITVSQVLDDPLRYHKCQTLDPIEPDYQGSKVVGKLYLTGSRPKLFSFAHGGRTFRLVRQVQYIEKVKGKTHDAAVETLSVMRLLPEIYDFGSALVLVEDGKVYPMDEHHLCHHLGSAIQYWMLKIVNGQHQQTLIDPPKDLCKAIITMAGRRDLKKLTAAITAPTIRLDGSILSKPGYDKATGLLLEMKEESANIPEIPTKEQAAEAVERLMYPFKDFPLENPLDWGVLLAALLTAVVRPILPTAPAFGIDAPVQASGKTLMGRAISALATGGEPLIWPHTNNKTDEEARKRIFTALRSGAGSIIWDNVIGIFDSAALAAALTSQRYEDRILGKPESSIVPNKAIFIITGNNLSIAGDLPRRVLICRINPETEKPFSREFKLDPVKYVVNYRQELAEAALTIIRWRHSSNIPRADGRMASFEEWDDLVRQTAVGLGDKEYGDPMEAVDIAQS